MRQHTTQLTHVRRPIEQANGLPNAHYIDPEVFAEERDAVLFDNWAGLAVAACWWFATNPAPCGFFRTPAGIAE